MLLLGGKIEGILIKECSQKQPEVQRFFFCFLHISSQSPKVFTLNFDMKFVNIAQEQYFPREGEQ